MYVKMGHNLSGLPVILPYNWKGQTDTQGLFREETAKYLVYCCHNLSLERRNNL